MSQHHVLPAGPETCHWGFFDAGLKPVVTVASGDTVTIDCVSGGPDILPEGGRWEILADHLAIHGGLDPGPGAHILTGPIAVDGAEPGDVLQVDILSIDRHGRIGATPASGRMPGRFPRISRSARFCTAASTASAASARCPGAPRSTSRRFLA